MGSAVGRMMVSLQMYIEGTVSQAALVVGALGLSSYKGFFLVHCQRVVEIADTRAHTWCTGRALVLLVMTAQHTASLSCPGDIPRR